jgi:DnaJ-class molecular chaperone
MSPALIDRQRRLDNPCEGGRSRLVASTQRSNQADEHGGLTLDDLITGVWEGLAVHDSVSCPACGGTMVSRSAARADTHEGACQDCGGLLY